MNSSISNFKGAEWKVLGTVAIAIVVLEIASRFMAPYLDTDRTHIHAFPEIIGEMKSAEKPRILIYGNSLLKWGLDDVLLEEEITKSTTAPCSVTKITPVGTAVRDWIYLYDTYFTRTDTHPEVVVVGFVAHHVPDEGELKMRRLARHFCSSKNLWTCLGEETDEFDTRAIGALSSVSAIYGDQHELQWGSVHWFVPEYSKGVAKVNHWLDAEAARAAKAKAMKDPSSKPKPKTYHQLARLIEQFNKDGVRAYFVPMPQPRGWDLDPNLVETVKKGGATLVDARAIPGMTVEDFPDLYHLGKSGTEKFTRFLAEVLAADLQSPE